MIKSLKRQLKALFFDGEVLKLMSLTFLTKPVSLVTQMLMAKYFGAGVEYDAYILSFFLVSFPYQLVGRVFAAVAIPHILEIRGRMSERGQAAYINALVGLGLVPATLFASLLVFRGNWIIDLTAGAAPPETKELAVRMLRVMAVPGILAAVVHNFKSIMNVNRAYRVPTVMPLINSAVMFSVLVAAHGPLGIWALPVAYAVSFSVQTLVIVGFAHVRGFVSAVLPRARRDDLKALWHRTWMVLVDSILLIVNTFMDKAFASSLIAGSISAIAYANTLMNLGMQLFQFSLVTVMFTRMSEDLTRGDIASCNRYLDDNLRRLGRLTVPVCLAIAVASTEIIRVLFQRAAFSADDTARTSAVLAAYILGLPAFLINLVVTRVFHSLKRLRDKMWLGLQYLLTNVAGNILLIGPLKVTGLAISSTFAIHLHLVLSVVVLSRYRTGLNISGMARRISVHYALGVLTWVIYRYAGPAGFFDRFGPDVDRWHALFIGAGRGISVLVIFAILLGIRRLIRAQFRDRAATKRGGSA